MSNEQEDLHNRRKRLIFRSWHRGTREMDLLMGSYADKYVQRFTAGELDEYEAILDCADPDIYDWIIGKSQYPANLAGPVMDKLLTHKYFSDEPA